MGKQENVMWENVLKYIKHVEVSCTVRGASNLTEELPSHAMLYVNPLFVSNEDRKVDLLILNLECDPPQDSKLSKVMEILTNAKVRLHQLFNEDYAENKALWVNFIRKVTENPDLKEKATCSFTIGKDAFECLTDQKLNKLIDSQFKSAFDYLRNNALKIDNNN